MNATSSQAASAQQFLSVEEAKQHIGEEVGISLTLSLLSLLSAQSSTIKIKDCRVLINYGLDKVRFMNPVKVGARIRARFTLESVEEKSPGAYLLKHKAVVDIEGETKPAMIAEWLGMSVR